MKRAALTAALLVAASALAQTGPTCGTVEMLEVTTLTRTKATAFLRTRLPDAPPSARSFFEGKIELANTMLPVGKPVTALVQHGENGHEAVLLVDLELSRVPAELVARLHPAALDFTLAGNLRSSAETPPMPVCAAGVLKIGTSAIRSAAPLGQEFARFGGARFSGLSLLETQGEATIVLYNPFSFALDVKDLVYEVWVGDRRVAAGERHGLRIHPGRESEVALPATAGNADLVAALAGAVAAGGRLEGRLVATISVKVGKDQTMTLPLNLPGTIQVAR